MKFISKYFIFLILVTAFLNISLCLNSEENPKKTSINPPNIIKKCRGYSENFLKQDEIETSNYVIFLFILSYFYTNYL